MGKIENSLQMYALIDASAPASVLKEVEAVVSTYGRRIRRGFCMTPHGESPVIFFEVKQKEGPIVEVLSALAEQYNLYPMYVVQENKDHLPKHAANTWYMIDEVKFMIPDFTPEMVEEWKMKYSQKIKEIYRDEHVFVKSFCYLGKAGVFHVMSFNTERSPMYRGKNIGVPEWNDVMEGILNSQEYEPELVVKMSVRYTNL